MSDSLERHQVACYLGAIAVAAAAALATPTMVSGLELAVTPLLALLLYATFLQVPAADLARAVRPDRFGVTTLLVNFLVVPAVVWILLPLVPVDDAIRLGVLLVLLCPCIDYVIVFTRLAGGDATRLLAMTPLLLLVQMLALPLYLWLLLGDDLSRVVEAGPFVTAFVALIVVPLLAAWATQWLTRGRLARTSRLARETTRWAEQTMVPLMMLVLFVMVASQLPHLDGRFGDLGPVAGVYALFFVVLLGIGVVAGRWAGLPVAEHRALVFSGVTRNSLVVLPLALALPAPLAATAAAVVVCQTLIELLGLTVGVRLVPRLISGSGTGAESGRTR